MTTELVRAWLNEVDEAKTAVLEARNGGLAYCEKSNELGEAARIIDSIYWKAEEARALIHLYLRDNATD